MNDHQSRRSHWLLSPFDIEKNEVIFAENTDGFEQYALDRIVNEKTFVTV